MLLNGGATLGLAYVGTMCNELYSVGLSQDSTSKALEAIAATAAHEMGHNFNMLHDAAPSKCFRFTAITNYIGILKQN